MWLLASPGHHQPWYWPCGIGRIGLKWARISTTCVFSMCSNDIKYKYMFIFPLENLAHKGLMCISYLVSAPEGLIIIYMICMIYVQYIHILITGKFEWVLVIISKRPASWCQAMPQSPCRLVWLRAIHCPPAISCHCIAGVIPVEQNY